MITVTGASGHIGNVLVKKLLKQGEEVRVLVLPHDDLTPIKGLEVEIVEGDVCDLPSLLPAFKGTRMVYHLAGIIPFLRVMKISSTRSTWLVPETWWMPVSSAE